MNILGETNGKIFATFNKYDIQKFEARIRNQKWRIENSVETIEELIDLRMQEIKR